MLHRYILAVNAACCFLINTEGIVAVDQSKFRTCQQTAFCQHHRHGNSQNLYQYKIIEESVQFHMPGEKEKDEKNKGTSNTGESGKSEDEKAGLWKSLQDRILGSGSSDDSNTDNIKDPYVRGPPPTLSGTLVNTAMETPTGKKEHLEFTVHALADGMVRLRITEVYHVVAKNGSGGGNGGGGGTPHDKARVTYDELVLTPETIHAAQHARWIRPGDSYLVDLLGSAAAANDYMGLQYGDAAGQHGMFLMLRIDSFAAYVYRESDLKKGPIITMGDKGLTHFEIRRLKDADGGNGAGDDQVEDEQNQGGDKPEKEIVGYWEDGLAIYADGTREERKAEEADHRQLTEAELKREGMWEEKFGQHVDHKRNGPTSVGSDITFPQSKFLFGLPEHASSTALKRTTGEGAEYEHPYRLYNLDVFEYDLDVPMALYGAVPLLVSQSTATGTSGVFWFNPTETFVDIDDDNTGSKTSHWISESGIIDVFFIPGPSPQEFYRQYSKLTGTMPLPPMFSLGYHQCRWNYKDEQDVYQVHDKFEELDYPYDVLWLDIEHTDGKRYFTWDKNLFPNPKQMQEKLWSHGRRMVSGAGDSCLRLLHFQEFS
jgi:Glycosyl hydrolases family 31/Galactose mutarotase-like